MELTTILGTIVGIIAVVGAMIFKHISFTVFINPAALFVIFVGTVACVLNAFPGRELSQLGKIFGKLLKKSDPDINFKNIKLIENLALLARKEGLLALESQFETIDDEFMQKGLRLVVDGAQEEYILEVLYIEIEAMEERHALGASIFTQACMYAPTLGVLGAVFGLIAAMGSINDTELMSHAIAAAFIATILGIFTGYVLWGPFANKLKVKSKHEVASKKIIVEGILSIQKGESPSMITEKLISFLAPDEKKAFQSQEGGDKEE